MRTTWICAAILWVCGTPAAQVNPFRPFDQTAFEEHARVLGAVAPDKAPQATNAAATLSTVGSQDWASGFIDLAGTIDTLAWLLPLLALLSLVGAVLLEPDRWNGLRRAGWAVVAAAGVG